MITYFILLLIVIYSGWVLYRNIREKLKGKCNSCSGCSLNGACPIQQLKNQHREVKLHLKG